MTIVDHPYLEGVKCRDDGAVFVPASRNTKGHWTFGSAGGGVYHKVGIRMKHYAVHRLICEGFHGCHPPEKKCADHIDRNPSNNKPSNLRWATYSENNRNTSKFDVALKLYGVCRADDITGYERARRAADPEKHREYCRRSYAKHREERLAHMKERREGEPRGKA